MKINFFATLALITSVAWGVESTIALRHRESQGVGYSKGYSTVDYYLMKQWNRLEYMVNLRGHLFNDGKAAGNGGMGLRYLWDENSSAIGMNLFYDFRSYTHFFAQQAAGGVEWLSKAIDVRLNGYLPVGKLRNFKTHRFQGFSGNQLLVKRKLSGALPCLEGEIGTALTFPFYFAVGAYYLFSETHSLELGKAWGWKGRFDVDMGRYFTIGSLITHDSIFKTRIQGYLSLNIPLGPWKPTRHASNNVRRVPIVRNEIIPIQVRKDSRVPFVSEGKIQPRFIFVNNQATEGDGTFEQPFSSFKEAEKKSQPGDIIYVYPGDGTARFMDQGIVLKEKQVLASSSAPLTIDTVEVPAQTPGVAPVITNIHPEQPVITNPGSTQLDDFHVIDPYDYLGYYESCHFSTDYSSSSWGDFSVDSVDLSK